MVRQTKQFNFMVSYGVLGRNSSPECSMEHLEDSASLDCLSEGLADLKAETWKLKTALWRGTLLSGGVWLLWVSEE